MQHKITGFGVSAMQQVQKMSITAKVMCAVILLLYLLSFIPGAEDNLAMIPAYIGPPKVKIWTLVTAILFENRLILVLLEVAALVGFTAFLEPLWGTREFLIFSGVVGLLSVASGVLVTVVCYAVLRSYTVLFAPYHGLIALICGYIVAVKQLHPDSVPLPPPAPPTLRIKHLPILLMVLSISLAVFKVVSYPFFWLVISGSFIAWIYLRFYQKKEQGERGDMSEGFAFATFFPEPIQPLLATLGGIVFKLLVSIKVCPKTVRTYDVGASSTIKLTLPGTDPADAQRRKQRALKALDERLKKGSEPLSWPNMDEAGSSSQDEQVPPPPAPPPSASESAVKAAQLASVVVAKNPPRTESSPNLPAHSSSKTETV